jgi:hypothetical protein
MYLMEVFPTLLTKVFVWGALFGHDADTSAMLPNFADVALHKEARDFVWDLDCRKEIGILAVPTGSGIIIDGWGARVVVEPADAADGLVLFFDILAAVGHFDGCEMHRFVRIIFLCAIPPPGRAGVVEVLGWL